MSYGPHLELLSEVMQVTRRDFPLADTSLLSPYNVNPLLDGEWMELNDSYQLVRGTGEAAVPSWQVFSLRGQYDTQAIGKAPVLFLGSYEAETDLFLATGLAVGNPLAVADVTIGGLVKRGLVKATGTGAHLVIGYVTRLIGSGATAKVRYVKMDGWGHTTL